MKKAYISPEMEILMLGNFDIIASSGLTGGDSGGENETPIDPFVFGDWD